MADGKCSEGIVHLFKELKDTDPVLRYAFVKSVDSNENHSVITLNTGSHEDTIIIPHHCYSKLEYQH